MIGLDTNIIVRHLVQDDPDQSQKASALIEQRLSANSPGFISVIAMAETVWVLERAYGFADADVALAIERLLATDDLVVECENEVFAALTALQDGTGSFADALIGALGSNAGCTHTFTFDLKAARLEGFRLL